MMNAAFLSVTRSILRICILVAVGVCTGPAPRPAGAGEARSDADLVQALLPSVVNIFVRKPPEQPSLSASGSDQSNPQQDTDNEQWMRFYGSGFVIDPSGLIVTNRHVIEGARDIIIAFFDGRHAMGKLVASGGEADIALVKIATDRPLPVLKFGDSDRIRIGDHVLV